MILRPFPRAAKTREGPVDLRSAEQVSDQRTGPVGGKACPVYVDGGLPRRAGEAAMTREGPVDLRSAEQVSGSEPARRGKTDTGLKGRFYAPKTFAIGS